MAELKSTTISGPLSGTSATFSGDLTIDTNTLYVDSTNNKVGIRNASPLNLFDVKGAIFTGSYATSAGARFHDNVYGINFGGIDASSVGVIQGSAFEVGAANIALQPNGGNVGIGTASPNGPLDVVGPTYGGLYTLSLVDSAAVAADIGGGIYFGGNYTGTIKTGWAGILGRKDNATDGQYGGYMVFQTRTHGSAPTERMRITSGGNVLIGTTTDTGQKLQVNGNIVSQSTGNPFFGSQKNAGSQYGFYSDGAGSLILVDYGVAVRGNFNMGSGTYTATSE